MGDNNKLVADYSDPMRANSRRMADFGNRLERAGAYLQQAGALPAMPPPPVIPQQTRCSFWNNQMVCN